MYYFWTCISSWICLCHHYTVYLLLSWLYIYWKLKQYLYIKYIFYFVAAFFIAFCDLMTSRSQNIHIPIWSLWSTLWIAHLFQNQLKYFLFSIIYMKFLTDLNLVSYAASLILQCLFTSLTVLVNSSSILFNKIT